MTQEHLLSTQNINDAFVQGRLGLYTEIPVEAIARNEENFDRWLAAHDAQIRAEALTLTEDEQKLVVDALYSESYRDKVCSANTITDYARRQAEFRRINNELSLGLFPMIAKHRKEQQ
ncbi:hypothetical protein [Bifidobacterium sp.]|jgi:hypothetical protein|uniref:hypothetical protein n=1 Tax=Bifidobacterium sp. TaxID=41200 RepID=UPI0025B80588|nr:hypothetical protein [Bifidobacterium sp.]MCI1635179.1 hypothetical protein [Bifidobacterium sp.]